MKTINIKVYQKLKEMIHQMINHTKEFKMKLIFIMIKIIKFKFLKVLENIKHIKVYFIFMIIIILYFMD